MKLSFLGGAAEVTGSRYRVETGSTRLIVDCGMCDAGRIKHHLAHNLGRRESTMVHGEAATAQIFRDAVHARPGWNATVPAAHSAVEF